MEIIKGLEMVIILLLGVAYITLGERKLMGGMQRRKGPNIVGVLGIIQPIVDGCKLIIKEIIIPQQVNKVGYIIGPLITLIIALIIWIPIPIYTYTRYSIIKESNYSIIYILAISSLSSFILLYSGWSSNSKYTFIGAIRSISQLISYEVSLGIIILNVMILNQSFNLIKILYHQIFLPNFFLLFPIFFLFLISALAETNRPPFDLPEAESELVAGLLTEFSGITFTFLYLSEYSFLFSMSLLSSLLFFGSSLLSPFFLFLFIWVRSTLPRIRYDQLLSLGWTTILPFSLSFLLFIISISFLFLP